MIELLPLDGSDIVRFAEALKSCLPGLDGQQFERRIRTYPELAQLARIPLFLVLMMALARSAAALPSSRADLIEAYLKTLFSPHEHKPFAGTEIEASKLRRVAEALAFERLERQEIGATDREVQDVAIRMAADAGSPETLLQRLLINGVLRRQSALRLQFPYPIIQEYLAACFLVRECPETLIQRIDDVIKRPWAQAIQFALELHPSPTPIITSMLERGDDAFATGLRLIGRCVANGCKVDPDVKCEISRRLANVWVNAPFHIRERVGRLIVDGFSVPLSPEVRNLLGLSWLVDSGAGEIVTRTNPMVLFPDPERRCSFIRRCSEDKTLCPEVRDIAKVFAVRYGSREALEDLVNRLETVEVSIAGAAIALLGHHPSRDIGVRAAEAALRLVTFGEEAVGFAREAVNGLTFIFQMDVFHGGALVPSAPHPALDVWTELVETWIARFDFTEIQRLRILTSAAQLGSAQALGVLEGLIRGLSDPDHPRYDEEDESGHYIRAAIYELRRRRRLLPLEVGERFARASRSNLRFAGVEAISAHADRPCLDLLVRLHNDLSDLELRTILLADIETLAGRLGVSILTETHTLKVS
jgi:hypothetical protein